MHTLVAFCAYSYQRKAMEDSMSKKNKVRKITEEEYAQYLAEIESKGNLKSSIKN